MERADTSKNKYNFTPIGNYVILSCLLEKEQTNLLSVGKAQPKIKEIQQVMAVGPHSSLKVGDWVVLDLQRFMKHVKVKSSIRAGVGGEDMIREEFVPPFVAVPGVDQPLLKVSDREIEGTIIDFDKLPDEIKEHQTMDEFREAQEALQKEGDKHEKEFRSKMAKAAKNRKDTNAAPVVITDSAKLTRKS